ncbi:hypothetical protein Cfor_04029 [Coptotermes formosanus]|uniref:Mos1 transposase HTH domain-containing protein n=1 Tax=Coptotermes formosanus TaxID=36987 RepID=A0A6L2Q8Z2_COPFO|nr:hypothetical protein Cfor_04029 [Coptotermes formosanus]
MAKYGMHVKQRLVTEFLAAEGEKPNCFHKSEVIVGVSTVRRGDEPGYSTVCARWVPRMLRAAHKETRKATATDILQEHDNRSQGLLSKIFTADETWVHHSEPKSE